MIAQTATRGVPCRERSSRSHPFVNSRARIRTCLNAQDIPGSTEPSRSEVGVAGERETGRAQREAEAPGPAAAPGDDRDGSDGDRDVQQGHRHGQHVMPTLVLFGLVQAMLDLALKAFRLFLDLLRLGLIAFGL